MHYSSLRQLKLEVCKKSNYGVVFSGSSLPLIFCIHVRSEPIFLGGYLSCKKDYKVMVFYM